MDDQERFRILKALDAFLEEKGIAPSGKDLLKFYAATTNSTIAIEERTWLQKVNALQKEGDIEAKSLADEQGLADMQAINLSPQGVQFLQMKNHISQPLKKNWVLNFLKWLVPSGFAVFVFVWGIWTHYHPVSSVSKQDEFIKQQKIACGLYPSLLSIQHSIQKKEKRINADRLQAYLRSNNYLPRDIYIQIENLLVSLRDKNYQAASEQVNDALHKSSDAFGCRISNTQSGGAKYPATSADVTTVRAIEN